MSMSRSSMRTRRPAPSPFEQLFTYRLHWLKKLTDKAMDDAFVARLGLPLTEARVLLSVGSFGPLSVSDLGRASNLDRSQASRATDVLGKKGLLTKEADEEDGRGVRIALTAKGASLFRKAALISRKRNDAILAVLSEAERATLAQALDKILASVLQA
ncbi:MarR family winged helix-turn-helix transcriptional regulator [Mycetohabitans sp. B4]|nr:MarR family winged helix-turn-helix transcriptional regulator [Mycetohabitans sp. B3]MCG1018171.1 MarR family winged helix-turn-helix transcriptional regulator [Mycetohabitans sp. B4]